MSVGFEEAAGPAGLRIYAIGDVHGRLDLLRRLHAMIDDEIARDRPDDWRIVHLGDYVDRGPDSAGVLELLATRIEADPRNVALAGNHDLGFLDFLAAPDPTGLFACYGGVQTARSYGIDLVPERPARLQEGWAALGRAVPERHRGLLSSLSFSLELGDFFFCHAGIRPGVALDRQSPDDLVWIRRAFHDWTQLHPKVIVHGHTPCGEPELLENRANIDTGAFRSGMLTALVIDGRDKRILQAR